jgi:hypothetical protein
LESITGFDFNPHHIFDIFKKFGIKREQDLKFVNTLIETSIVKENEKREE